jgi:hypothetical protein
MDIRQALFKIEGPSNVLINGFANLRLYVKCGDVDMTYLSICDDELKPIAGAILKSLINHYSTYFLRPIEHFNEFIYLMYLIYAKQEFFGVTSIFPDIHINYIEEYFRLIKEIDNTHNTIISQYHNIVYGNNDPLTCEAYNQLCCKQNDDCHNLSQVEFEIVFAINTWIRTMNNINPSESYTLNQLRNMRFTPQLISYDYLIEGPYVEKVKSMNSDLFDAKAQYAKCDHVNCKNRTIETVYLIRDGYMVMFKLTNGKFTMVKRFEGVDPKHQHQHQPMDQLIA